MSDREPFISVKWGRYAPLLKLWRHAGRIYVTTRRVTISAGKRWPLDDGWPQ